MAFVLAACGTTPSANDGSAPASPGADGARNGTADGAVRGGTLNILGAGDVDYLDPNVTYYSAGYTVSRLYSRQLFTNPADPALMTTSVPDLAEQVPTTDNGGISVDGRTYTITLRQGVQWDTVPPRQVTAADEVIGIKRTCNPAQPFSGLPNFLDLIAGFKEFCDGFAEVGQDATAIATYIQDTPLPGVTARDERTVVFTLTRPATYFVDMLTLPALSPAPVELLSYVPGSTEVAQHMISNGPYRIERYDPTKRIELSRNPAWNAATDPIRGAFVDRIVIDETQTQESVQQQLQTGSPGADMQFDVSTPASQIPGLLAANDPNLLLGDTAASNPYIIYNLRSPNNNSALSDVRVRRAISHAINRDNILQVNGGPQIAPALTHVLPPNIVGSQDHDPYPHDPDRARQLLAEAGFPNGLTLKYLYRNASETGSKTFATVQQDLVEVGITVEGVPSPNADFYTEYLQVPDVAGRGRVGPRGGELERRLVRQRRVVVLQPAVLRVALLPTEREQLRLLRQPRHQCADPAGRLGHRRGIGSRRVGEGGPTGHGGRGVLSGDEPEVADVPRLPRAQRRLHRCVAEFRPGQRLAVAGEERRLNRPADDSRQARRFGRGGERRVADRRPRPVPADVGAAAP